MQWSTMAAIDEGADKYCSLCSDLCCRCRCGFISKKFSLHIVSFCALPCKSLGQGLLQRHETGGFEVCASPYFCRPTYLMASVACGLYPNAMARAFLNVFCICYQYKVIPCNGATEFLPGSGAAPPDAALPSSPFPASTENA